MFKRYFYIEGLTNLIDSDAKYLINIFGHIKDKLGIDIPFTLDSEGHKIVNVQSWDGLRDYRVIDLVALQFKNIQIPKSQYSRVKAFVMVDDKLNTHAVNIGYRFENGPIEVENNPGFFYVPGYPFCGITKEGGLLNVHANNEKNWSITKPGLKNTKGGYRVTVTRVGINKHVPIARHRALALTFLPYPDNVDDLVVNHINGIPGDDRIENLEWVTRGQNNVHAYTNDLKNQNDRVLARNVRTGDITEYYSVSECSRQFGYSIEAIRFRLTKGKFCLVFADGYQFKYKSDPRDWVIPEDIDKAINNAKVKIGKTIHVRNCKTMEEFTFESLGEVSNKTGINSSTIQFRLKYGITRPIMGYQFKDDDSAWTEFTQEELDNSFTPNSFKIDARNLLTGEVMSFDSVRESRIISSNNAGYVLSEGRQPFFNNGWQLKYRDDEWQEIENVEEELYKLTRDITALEESTGKIIIAESAVQMGLELGLDSKAIRVAAMSRGNKLYHGYRFRLGVSNDPWPTTELNVEIS